MPFSRLEPHEVSKCESPITEGEIVAALRQVGTNKVLELDGLSYEIYHKMPPMFVHLLAIVFNIWFNKGKIPQKITRGVIPFLRIKQPRRG